MCNCERCGRHAGALAPSMFAMEMICLACLAKERQTPLFKKAQAVPPEPRLVWREARCG